MGLSDRFRRRRGGAPAPAAGRVKGLDAEVVRHLSDFAQTRAGVEVFIEPSTTVTEMTVVFVARDGEWTRRRVPDAKAAEDLGKRLGVPVHHVHVTGYPPRMREWSARQSRGEVAAPTREDELFAALERDFHRGDEP